MPGPGRKTSIHQIWIHYTAPEDTVLMDMWINEKSIVIIGVLIDLGL